MPAPTIRIVAANLYLNPEFLHDIPTFSHFALITPVRLIKSTAVTYIPLLLQSPSLVNLLYLPRTTHFEWYVGCSVLEVAGSIEKPLPIHNHK